MFRLEKNLMPAAVYFCPFPGEKTLYLVEVEVPPNDPDDPESGFDLELVMTGKGILDPVPLCRVRWDADSRLDQDMENLLDAVEDAVVLPHLSPEAENIIRDYLTDAEGGCGHAE